MLEKLSAGHWPFLCRGVQIGYITSLWSLNSAINFAQLQLQQNQQQRCGRDFTFFFTFRLHNAYIHLTPASALNWWWQASIESISWAGRRTTWPKGVCRFTRFTPSTIKLNFSSKKLDSIKNVTFALTFTNKLVKSLWKSQQAGGWKEEVGVKRNCSTNPTTPFWKRVVHANVQSLPDWLSERRYKSLQLHYCVPRGFGKKVQLCLLSPFRCTDTDAHKRLWGGMNRWAECNDSDP